MPTHTDTFQITGTTEFGESIHIVGTDGDATFLVRVSTVDADRSAWSAVAIRDGRTLHDDPAIAGFVRFLDGQGWDLEVRS